jgi:hypothetical protein
MAVQPTLRFDPGTQRHEAASVGVDNLDSALVASLGKLPQIDSLLQSVLRVSVIETDRRGCDELPDVLGRYELAQAGFRFIPRFPFEPGVCYRASLDVRPLGRGARLTGALTLEFSLPVPIVAHATSVTNIFPSADVLPENLLRFYVCFSRAMRRGLAGEQIRLLGPTGKPVPDALYRPPLELWDRTMRCLTVLLDPGRLKRWVGPNRELGPPLKVGQGYTLAVGSGMVDASGFPLHQNAYKPFVVAEAVREPVVVAHWNLRAPAAMSRQPLAIEFARPLDWALLRRAMTVVGDDARPIPGRVEIERGERCWRFTPASPWTARWAGVRIAPELEDVCGNSLFAAFDGPLRAHCDAAVERAYCTIPFELTDRVAQCARASQP